MPRRYRRLPRSPVPSLVGAGWSLRIRLVMRLARCSSRAGLAPWSLVVAAVVGIAVVRGKPAGSGGSGSGVGFFSLDEEVVDSALEGAGEAAENAVAGFLDVALF